jgi:ribosomal protein S18 acetylase RimI-like enzyme
MITYRPVDRERDLEFAREVHHSVYRDVVTRQFGAWNEEMQDRFFEEEWWASPFQHILFGGKSVGLVSVATKDDHRFIYEIMVLPAYQGRGIGTEVLRGQIAEASRRSQPLKLKVLRMNKAQELYRRMGFVPYDESDVFTFMIWQGEGND